MAQLGEAMQVRRGILPAPAPATGDSVAALRKDYGQHSLNEADVADDPFDQFNAWFEQALAAEVNEPNAMSVATVDADGRPTSRIVLIKQYDRRGFTWYTNYDSQKGRQLAANPNAALLFFWSELERQIRIEGVVERTSARRERQIFPQPATEKPAGGDRLGAKRANRQQGCAGTALRRGSEAIW